MRRILKFVGWLIGVVLILVLLVFLLPHIPPVQSWLVNKAENYYSDKTGQAIEIGKIFFWPDGTIVLKEVNLRDDKDKPFIDAGEVRADISIRALFKGDFILTFAEVESGSVAIERRRDGTFNFKFLVDAFSVKESSSSSTGSFSIDRVFLENTTFMFSDRRSRLYTKAYVRLLQTSFSTFDPDEQIFHLNKVDLYGGNGFVLDLSEKASDDTSASQMPDVFFSEVNLYNTRYMVHMKRKNILLSSYAGELHAKVREFDLERSLLEFEEVTMRNSGANLVLGEPLYTAVKPSSAGSGSPDWIVMADKIMFRNSWFSYDDKDAEYKPKGFDPSHISFGYVSLTARNVVNAGSNVKAVIIDGSIRTNDGFSLNKIKGEFNVSERSLGARSFRIVTNSSNLSGDFITRQKSYRAFSKDLSSVRFYVNLAPSRLSVNDLVYFSHSLDSIDLIRGNRSMQVALQGNAQGTMKQLTLNRFVAGVYGSTANVTGRLMNLDSASSFAYDLSIEKLNVQKQTIDRLVPDTMIPPNIQVPEKMLITGTAAGNTSDHSFDLAGNTSDGSFKVTGSAGKKGYDMTAVLDTLNIGKIISKERSLGRITGNVNVKSNSLKPDSAVGSLNASIASVRIKNHNYHDVNADLKMNAGTYELTANSNDPKANFSMEGSGTYKEGLLSASLNARIDTLDFYTMGVTSDTLAMKGHVEVTANGKSMDDFHAEGKASRLYIRRDQLRLNPDSLLFTMLSRGDVIALDLNSSLIDVDLNGTGKLSTLTPHLASYFKSYFGKDSLATDSIDSAHQLDFMVHLKKPDELAVLVDPSLSLTPLTIKGRFNGQQESLTASGNIDRVSYKGNAIDSIKFEVKGDPEKLASTITAPSVVSKGMLFPNPAVSVIIENDSINYVASVTGNDTVQRLRLEGLVEHLDDGYAFSVKPGGFILNNKSWDVTPGNKIIFDSSGVAVKDFKISRDSQLLEVNEITEDQLTVTAKDFELMDLSMIADSNAYKTGGRLSGDISFPIKGEPSEMHGNFTVKDLNFRNDTMGDVSLAVTKQGEHKIGIETTLAGHGNSIKIKGTYDFVDTYSPFDFTLNITQVNMASLKPYLGPIFEKMEGYAKANVTLRGNTVYPVIDGDILITDASLLPKYTNSWIRIKDQPVHVDQSSFLFKNFLMTDSLNDPALLNGYICPEGLPHITFDLMLVTSNFMVLNTREGDNEQYFGHINVTSIATVKGDDTNPFVNINARLDRGSRVTLLVPELKLRESNEADVVQFINLKADSVKNQLKKKRKEPSFAGVTLTSNIEVDENSEFKLLIDPVAGDSLSVKGKTTFSFSIDPGGKMSMAGVYEVTEGSYLLTLTTGLKRRFDLARGSRITWNGNPVNPDLDVSATYTVRAAPYDLVVNDITAFTDNTAISYREEMPFIINLKMNGALSGPAVSFNVQLPSDQQGALEGTVYARLNQLNQNESELNTQVFSLLVLNRFFNQQEIQNYGGPLFSSYARTGVSRLISQRLNSFATTYAKFVELQLDVDFYETYNGTSIENTTNMRIGIGRKFFSDRLDLRTGGQVLLQGTSQFNNNDFPSLMSAEYKLTRDGRYRLTGFRKNTYEGVFEGQIVREGAGIVFIRDFNKFGELFKRPDEHDLLDAAPKPRQ